MYLPTLSIVLDSLSECIILLLLTEDAKRGTLSDASLTKGQSKNNVQYQSDVFFDLGALLQFKWNKLSN